MVITIFRSQLIFLGGNHIYLICCSSQGIKNTVCFDKNSYCDIVGIHRIP